MSNSHTGVIPCPKCGACLCLVADEDMDEDLYEGDTGSTDEEQEDDDMEDVVPSKSTVAATKPSVASLLSSVPPPNKVQRSNSSSKVDSRTLLTAPPGSTLSERRKSLTSKPFSAPRSINLRKSQALPRPQQVLSQMSSSPHTEDILRKFQEPIAKHCRIPIHELTRRTEPLLSKEDQQATQESSSPPQE